MAIYEVCPECQSNRVTREKSYINDELIFKCHTCGLVYSVEWGKGGAVKDDSDTNFSNQKD